MVTCALVQYKNLEDNLKELLDAGGELEDGRMIYLVKENGVVKTITTSVCSAIQKIKSIKK